MGLFLLAVTLGVVGLVFGLALARYRQDRRREAQAEASASRVEPAALFDASKFRTTLETLARTKLPALNALVFYYTSAAEGSEARKSGLPARAEFGGVPFSLRQPHFVTAAERAVFGGADGG